ncbi:MAG: hypothetical protein SGI92_25985 [Bryobacteraceae bacterium]|nr:hypothetical protein [Bryobacteraceae bacterium]
MKKLFLLSVFALAMSVASAASIDGKWSVDVQTGGKKAAAKKLTFVMDLKSSGDALSGTVSAEGKARSVSVAEGKVTGDSFRFVTVQGDNKVVWSGTVKGDAISGSRGRDGAKRAPSFTGSRVK